MIKPPLWLDFKEKGSPCDSLLNRLIRFLVLAASLFQFQEMQYLAG